jgi:hypothetical protein
MKESKKENTNISYQLDISFNNERFYLNEWLYDYYYSNAVDEKQSQVFFFSQDRSIYRPGQTLYFKGITLLRDTKKGNSIWKDYPTTVYLHNQIVNHRLNKSCLLMNMALFQGNFNYHHRD